MVNSEKQGQSVVRGRSNESITPSGIQTGPFWYALELHTAEICLLEGNYLNIPSRRFTLQIESFRTKTTTPLTDLTLKKQIPSRKSVIFSR